MSASLQEPKPKKAKVEDNNGEDYDEKSPSLAEAQRNEQGEAYFELSKTRRVTIRQFKGKTLVDIREYYEKDGKMMPGKKGISLNNEQYLVLAELLRSGSIDKAVADLEGDE